MLQVSIQKIIVLIFELSRGLLSLSSLLLKNITRKEESQVAVDSSFYRCYSFAKQPKREKGP